MVEIIVGILKLMLLTEKQPLQRVSKFLGSISDCICKIFHYSFLLNATIILFIPSVHFACLLNEFDSDILEVLFYIVP